MCIWFLLDCENSFNTDYQKYQPHPFSTYRVPTMNFNNLPLFLKYFYLFFFYKTIIFKHLNIRIISIINLYCWIIQIFFFLYSIENAFWRSFYDRTIDIVKIVEITKIKNVLNKTSYFSSLNVLVTFSNCCQV